jgi:hypothetical protein
MAKITAPRFDAYAPGGRLTPTARQYPGVNVVSVEERTRAAQIAAELQAGGEALAPKFQPVQTKAPYEPVTPSVPLDTAAGGRET